MHHTHKLPPSNDIHTYIYYHTWTRSSFEMKIALSIFCHTFYLSSLIYCTLFPLKIWNMNFEIANKMESSSCIYTHFERASYPIIPPPPPTDLEAKLSTCRQTDERYFYLNAEIFLLSLRAPFTCVNVRLSLSGKNIEVEKRSSKLEIISCSYFNHKGRRWHSWKALPEERNVKLAHSFAGVIEISRASREPVLGR